MKKSKLNESTSAQPNILLIMTDQQRYDYLSVHGGKCRTPALERLAAEGTDFTNAYSVCSLCTPARASIFTGRYPHKHGMWNNCDMFSAVRHSLPDSEILLNCFLAEAGYACGYSGKWHIDKDRSATDRGFEGYSLPGYGNPWHLDERYGQYLESLGFGRPRHIPVVEVENRPMTYVLDCDTEATVEHFQTNIAIELMRDFARSRRPFFLTVQYWGPHEPSRPTTHYAGMYPADSVPLVNSYRDDLRNRPRQYARHRDEFECWYYGASKLGPEKWREVTAKYCAYTTMIDEQILRVLNELDSLGIAGNTMVIFTTDHGNLCGARGGLYDKGVAMFEDTYHIPFLVRWPGVVRPAAIDDRLVSNMDILATVLDAAGVSLPEGIDSRSILPILTDPEAEWREDLMCWSSGVYYLHSQRMLRWRSFKYVFTPYDIDELYDLEKDPNEMGNCIDDRSVSDVKRELRERLYRNAAQASDPLAEVMQGYFRI